MLDASELTMPVGLKEPTEPVCHAGEAARRTCLAGGFSAMLPKTMRQPSDKVIALGYFARSARLTYLQIDITG